MTEEGVESLPEPLAWRDVRAERLRQVSAEGWHPEHDDEHEFGELADAAVCYARHAGNFDPDGPRPMYRLDDDQEVPDGWPWDTDCWKPKDRRRDLVRAGALILAEIERLDRAEARDALAGAEVGLGVSQPAQPDAKSLAVVDLKCAECGHVDTVYAGSLSAQSCPNCKCPRPAHVLESASPSARTDQSPRTSDARREALSDAAKATCEKCARGDGVEFQADPTPMYWHRAVECPAAPIHALLARTR